MNRKRHVIFYIVAIVFLLAYNVLSGYRLYNYVTLVSENNLTIDKYDQYAEEISELLAEIEEAGAAICESDEIDKRIIAGCGMSRTDREIHNTKWYCMERGKYSIYVVYYESKEKRNSISLNVCYLKKGIGLTNRTPEPISRIGEILNNVYPYKYWGKNE